MAQYQKKLRTEMPFDEFVKKVTEIVMSKSMSATLEESIDTEIGNTKCAMRTLERYSATGGNRVSMTIVFLTDGESDKIQVIATSTGGSGGIFKIVPWGESEFLETLITTLK